MVSKITKVEQIAMLTIAVCRSNSKIKELESELAKTKTCLENTMAIENDLHNQLAESVTKSALVFPVMLRKMWSGSEVQSWLDRITKGDR